MEAYFRIQVTIQIFLVKTREKNVLKERLCNKINKKRSMTDAIDAVWINLVNYAPSVAMKS